MKLVPAWHGWFSTALAVMDDGMLAVSAQCGCCHHFLTSSSMPFHAFSFFGVMPFVLFFFWPVACFIVCILVLSSLCHLFFTYNITWFGVWLYFVFGITWCMCCGDYGLSFGGGSYSSVYVPPPMFVFPMILIICIPSLFGIFPSFIFCIPISWYTLPLVLPFPFV